MDLRNYVKIYDVFDKKLCNTVVKQLKNKTWTKHQYNDPATNKNLSYDDDLSITHTEIDDSDEIKQINSGLWFIIDRYIRKDLIVINDWYNTWVGYSHVRFNRYDKNTKMRIHCDHIHSMFDGERRGIPILTLLGGLNDNYAGGELFMFKTQQVELKAGQVMVFPSNFLYPHEVKPVTKGVRYSFVSWVW
jgi:hypothetical protein